MKTTPEAALTRTRAPGAEPVRGYRLIEPLGRGGFGEVWKCEAPGGLLKAIKFVGPGDGGRSLADQELAALQGVKVLRHPFLLSMDRVELVDGVLLIIMELADQNLHMVQQDYRARGQTGIPRDELLGYLAEAAEALDAPGRRARPGPPGAEPEGPAADGRPAGGRRLRAGAAGVAAGGAAGRGAQPALRRPGAGAVPRQPGGRPV